MKALNTLLVIGLGLLFIALLTWGVVKATQDLSYVIQTGINNMYSVGE